MPGHVGSKCVPLHNNTTDSFESKTTIYLCLPFIVVFLSCIVSTSGRLSRKHWDKEFSNLWSVYAKLGDVTVKYGVKRCFVLRKGFAITHEGQFRRAARSTIAWCSARAFVTAFVSVAGYTPPSEVMEPAKNVLYLWNQYYLHSDSDSQW